MTQALNLTVAQAAERANVSRQHIVAEIQDGNLTGAFKLDPTKATSPWLIPMYAFRAWMKKRGQPITD